MATLRSGMHKLEHAQRTGKLVFFPSLSEEYFASLSFAPSLLASLSHLLSAVSLSLSLSPLSFNITTVLETFYVPDYLVIHNSPSDLKLIRKDFKGWKRIIFI